LENLHLQKHLHIVHEYPSQFFEEVEHDYQFLMKVLKEDELMLYLIDDPLKMNEDFIISNSI
jgi:hypothetical protein